MDAASVQASGGLGDISPRNRELRQALIGRVSRGSKRAFGLEP